MKQRTFIALMVVLALVLVGTGLAVWRFVFAPASDDAQDGVPPVTIRVEDIKVDPDGALTWTDPNIEVGTLTYTVTRAQVLQNLSGIAEGSVREGAVLCIYGADGSETMYYYPDFVDGEGNLVDGACLVLLDVLVESEDAVNFVTNAKTGEQKRRYEDNPFLFRADEIAYLIDTGDSAQVYYDAVFFNGMDRFSEHEMAYELDPGESVTLRIGFLIGNRADGSAREYGDFVISTKWNEADEKYFNLGLS